MKISIQENSQFLRPSEVKAGDVVVILNEGEVRESDFGTGKARKVFEIEVDHNKVKKLWTMNKTTMKIFVEKWGDDTKKWIGKTAKLSLVKVNVRGQIKDSIVGEPVEIQQSTAAGNVPIVKI